jgi:hypothetical protein
MQLRQHLFVIGLACTCFWCLQSDAQDSRVGALVPAARSGLVHSDKRAYAGYTIIAPLASKKTFLIDMEGRVVHSWSSDWQPALGARLLEDGRLLRCGAMLPHEQPFGGPGAAGRIQMFSWEGELLWNYEFAADRLLPHHDITPLPNGNVLIVAWDRKTTEEAMAAGRSIESIDNGQLLADCLLEIKPTGKTTGEIVWKWHAWDHLIQDYDATKKNFGAVGEHPELIDVNLTEGMFGNLELHPDARLAGRTRGFAEKANSRHDISRDWTHINSVAYNSALDQIVLSVRAFSEIWIIDHGITVAEAASHQGGRYGKGGDLLYRWGNAATYRAGSKANQRLFKQHDAHWIPTGLPGAGHILLFNNGNNRPDVPYSTADEIVTPVTPEGRYPVRALSPFEPKNVEWTYAAPVKTELFSMVVSGAQRLPNGNTLICSGANGTLLEVTAEHDVVWKYINPVQGNFLGARPHRELGTGRGGLPHIHNAVFRANRYGPDYPAFRDKALVPGKSLVEVALENAPGPVLNTAGEGDRSTSAQ